MANHFDGYVSDALYPSYFHETHSPAWIDALLSSEGLASPRQSPQGTRGQFTFLDLGCGDATALILLSAAYPDARFVGIDANPEHIAKGRETALSLGVENLDLRCMMFDEALACAPVKADYVMSFGVLTWVTERNRAQLIAAIDRHLSDKGVAVISYNCLPGWKDMLSFQRLALQLSQRMAGPGEERFAQVIEEIRRLASLGISSVDETHLSFIDHRRGAMDAGYFPHEYLNKGWRPVWSPDVIEMIKDAGLQFLRSAARKRWSEELYLGATLRTEIEGLEEATDRELMVDLFLDTWFRIDLFCRSNTKLQGSAVSDPIDQRWLLSKAPQDVAYSVESSRVAARFDNPAARAIVHRLEHGPATLREIHAQNPEMSEADLLFACDCHVQAGNLHPVDPPADIDADKINAWIANAGNAEPRIAALVTPGGVLSVPADSEGSNAVADALGSGATLRRMGLA